MDSINWTGGTMKIVFFEAENWECDILQQICCNHEVVFTEEALGRQNVHLYLGFIE